MAGEEQERRRSWKERLKRRRSILEVGRGETVLSPAGDPDQEAGVIVRVGVGVGVAARREKVEESMAMKESDMARVDVQYQLGGARAQGREVLTKNKTIGETSARIPSISACSDNYIAM